MGLRKGGSARKRTEKKGSKIPAQPRLSRVQSATEENTDVAHSLFGLLLTDPPTKLECLGSQG